MPVLRTGRVLAEVLPEPKVPLVLLALPLLSNLYRRCFTHPERKVMIKPIVVYGTLMYGHPMMQTMRHVGPVRVRGYTLLDLGAFPIALFSKGGAFVEGELYEFPDDEAEALWALRNLDRYETALYKRVEVQAIVPGYEFMPAQMYVASRQYEPVMRNMDRWE